MTEVASSFRVEIKIAEEDLKDMERYQNTPLNDFIAGDISYTQPDCSFWINEQKLFEYFDYLFGFLGFHLTEIKTKGHYEQTNWDGPGIMVRITRPEKGVLQLVFMPEHRAEKIKKMGFAQGPHLVDEDMFYREAMKAGDRLLWTMKQHYPALLEIDQYRNLDAELEAFSRLSGIPRKKSWTPGKHMHKKK
jgi:hypothetical protein